MLTSRSRPRDSPFVPTLIARPAVRSDARSRRRSRRGLTLLELLIVLVIMGVGAGLVVFNRGVDRVASETDVITRARRTAVARAERLSLMVGADGEWELRTSRGDVLERGRNAGVSTELQIDQLGSCSAGVARATSSINPLTCTWQAGTP